jgi:hypothetical protein
MRAVDVPPVVAEAAHAPVRIRHVLVAALLLLVVWQMLPRGKAAWQLHAAAAGIADYALCMVGPTGPSALRDNPRAFWRLVRRRLVTARADERPFAPCARAAGELAGSVETERAHLAPASAFVEYGGKAADRAVSAPGGELTVASLLVTTRPLARLVQDAWPFVRGGYTQLVKASSHAREAIHPAELPRPAVGRGLPATGALYEATRADARGIALTMGHGTTRSVFRSADGGINWKVAALSEPAVQGLAGRCPAGESGASFAFGRSEDRRSKIVRSILADGSESRATLVDADARVLATGCDAGALVAVVGAPGTREISLHHCAFDGACRLMNVPPIGATEGGPRYPVDVARLGGVTVLSTSMHGIVRVASTRDDGETWTPWVVAYDSMAHEDLATPPVPPVQLLVIGTRLMLYGGADAPSGVYPVLFSDDAGASWRGS